MTKKNIINNNENVLNVKDYPYKTYTTNNYESHIGYVENNLYKKQDSRTLNNTNNIYIYIYILINIQLMSLITIR